jgi:hypothetical protein
VTVDVTQIRPGDMVMLRDKSVLTVKLVKQKPEVRTVARVVFEETGEGHRYTQGGWVFSGQETDADIIAVFDKKGECK